MEVDAREWRREGEITTSDGVRLGADPDAGAMEWWLSGVADIPSTM